MVRERQPPARPESARGVAYRALCRIEHEGAYANILLGPLLGRSRLGERDRRFVTELVYGTTRMRRACDVSIDRFVLQPPDDNTRTLLRLGAYQLMYAGVPAHAAVAETVQLASSRTRGFVNAVLRRIAAQPVPPWPGPGAELSYPDWIVSQLVDELGEQDALTALARMNEPATVTVREDGYVQDRSSQWVAELVDAQPTDWVLDVCAAPGGKATALADRAGVVIAADLQPHRAGLIAANAGRLGKVIPVVVADATAPPFAAQSFDRVLIDAPCSGLGALRRRPDARWRVERGDIRTLARVQQRMIDTCAPLVRPGGLLVYSVCTLTAAESIEHRTPDGFVAQSSYPAPWSKYGDGARLLPQDADTDGMTVRRWRRVG